VDWSFCIVGGAAHGSIFMVRDYDATQNYNNLLDRVIRHRDAIISHLNWVCIFLGCHAFGFYIHNDTMQALGRPQDMFSDNNFFNNFLPNGFKGYQLHLEHLKCISS
jgi:photosystem I P700 chlorophyll a apoprotein A1